MTKAIFGRETTSRASLIQRIQKIFYYRCMIYNLKWRLRHEVRSYHKQYYPIRWVRVSDIVREDISAYLKFEGKGKHVPLELVNTFYESSKDMQDQIEKYYPFSLALLAYMACYALNLKLPISFSGISVDYNPTVLVMAMMLGAFLGYKVSVLSMHLQNVKGAIKAVLSSMDPQIGESLKSAVLYADNGETHVAQSNPQLIPTAAVSRTAQAASLLAVIGILLVLLFVWYLYIRAGFLIYSTASVHYGLNLALLAVTFLLSLGSTFNVIASMAPLRYKDWATNSKFEILDQLNPSESQRFGNQVYSRSSKLAIAIDRTRQRLAAIHVR